MKSEINKFSIYNPSCSVKVDNFAETKTKIEEDLRLKLEKFFVEVDNEFSIDNFEYVTKEMTNERITSVY